MDQSSAESWLAAQAGNEAATPDWWRGFYSRFTGDPTGGRPAGYMPGNIDLNTRPVVHNPDGSISTVRTMGIGTDRGYVNVPTVSDEGRILSPEDAVGQFHRTGRHLGMYPNQAIGEIAAQQLHEQQARQYLRGIYGG